MQKFKSIFSYFVLILLLTNALTSCTKQKEDTVITKQDKAANQNSLAEALYADVNATVSTAFNDSGIGKTSNENDNCANSTLTPNDVFSYPKNVVIDFGSTNCTGSDGRQRRGKILATLTQFYLLPGATLNISFDNYYVNDHKVEGTITYVNTSANNSVSFTEAVQNGKITLPNSSDFFTWNSNRNLVYDASATATITGSASGVTSGSDAFTCTIVQPLIINQGCHYIVKGVSSLTVNQTTDLLVLDYGNGTCDNLATLTYFNQTNTITLPY